MPKRTNMITRGDERVMVLDWNGILRFFLIISCFSILWVLKIKLLHFHKHPVAKNSQVLHMLNHLPTKKKE